MSQLRVALIGCGAAARGCHVPALPDVPGVALTALIDPVTAHAEAALAQYREACGASREATEATEVTLAADVTGALKSFDAAVVVAPHTTHASIAEVLLAHGKAVLMEKPMTTGPRDARRLAGLVADTPGAVFAMAHPRRLFPASVWVRDLVRRGDLGEVRRLRWREGHPYSHEPATLSMFDAGLAGGGVVTDTGSHVFDLLMWWLGPDVEVLEYADNSLGGVESDARIVLRWGGGAEAEVELSRLRGLGTSCEVVGTEATATIGTDFPAGTCTLVRRDGTVLHEGEVAAVPPSRDVWEELFVEQLRDFAAAAVDGTAPHSTLEDGLRVVELIDSCYHGPARRSMPQPWIQPIERNAHV